MNQKHFAIIAIIILALSLTACPPGPDPDHTHTYSTTWSKNATQHWHECSCGDKKDIANHSGNPCTVCGYTGSTVPPTCICPNGTDHWEGDACCLNNDGNKTTDCTCNSVAKASGTHVANTPYYDGEDDSCYVTFNGQRVKRPGDNCVSMGQRPVVHNPKAIEFGTNLSTTVTTPAMTDAQWNTVITNLTFALNAAANGGGDLGSYTAGFFGVGGYGIVIDLVKNPPEGYSYYKLDTAAFKILLNADYAIGATVADLSAKIAAVITSIDGSTPTQAKAPAHDNGLERLNCEAIAINNQARDRARQVQHS